MQGHRRKGRELALKIIYGLQDQSSSVEEVIDDFWGSFRLSDDLPGEPPETAEAAVPVEVRRFAEGLVNGVAEHLESIDDTIKASSTNWSLERMARVDLSLLRLGAFEILYCPDVPDSVAINEAVEIGKRYGTKETPAFVNGILDKIARSGRAG